MNVSEIKLLDATELNNKKGKRPAPAYLRLRLYDHPSGSTGIVYFNVEAARMCGISKGRFIHFANPNNGKLWYFVVNDNAGGSKIMDHGTGFSLRNKNMIQRFTDTTKAPIPAKFYIQDTGEMLGDDKLYEILTHKAIGSIGK